jgi:hypothetical protein
MEDLRTRYIMTTFDPDSRQRLQKEFNSRLDLSSSAGDSVESLLPEEPLPA